MRAQTVYQRKTQTLVLNGRKVQQQHKKLQKTTTKT